MFSIPNVLDWRVDIIGWMAQLVIAFINLYCGLKFCLTKKNLVKFI